MILLGIDQSQTTNCGVAVVDMADNANPLILYHAVENYKKQDGIHNIPNKDKRWRCRRFAATVQDVFSRFQPDLVITEIVRAFHQNQKDVRAIIALSQIQGCLYLIVPKTVPIYCINTGSWQAAVLHPKQGDDRKKLSIALVEKRFELVVSEHEADAINLCLSYPLLCDRGNDNVLVKM